MSYADLILGGAASPAPAAATGGYADLLFNEAPANPVAKAGQSMVEQIPRQLGLTARYLTQGGLALPAMIGDAANVLTNYGIEGVNAVTGAEIPKLGRVTDAISGALDKAGLPRPQGGLERVIGSAAEGVAGAGAGVAGGAKLAANASSDLLKSIGNVFSTAPVVQLSAGAGGGTGSQLAAEVAPDSATAQIAGGLGGAMVGGMVPVVVNSGGRLLRALVEPLTPSGQDRVAGESLLRLSSQPRSLLSKIDQAPELVPGSRPTTGQATADPGLLTAERAIRSADTRGIFAGQDATNDVARRSFVQGLERVPAGPQNVAQAVTGRLDDFTDATGKTIGKARQTAANADAALGLGTSPAVAGSVIREQLGEAQGQALSQVSRAYKMIDPTGSSAFDGAPIYQRVAGTVNEYFGRASTGTPSELLPMLQRLRAQSLSFADLDALMKDFGRVAGKASMAGDRPLASVAKQAQDAIRDQIDTATQARQGFTPQQAEAYRMARAARADAGQRFEQGAAGRVGATKAFGEPTLSPSEVPAAFFNATAGGPDDAAQFIAALGGREPARQALQNYAVSNLRDFATNPDGTLNRTRWANWYMRHSKSLAQFPELRRQLDEAGRAQSLVDNLVGRRERTLAEVEKGAARYFLKSDPDIAVRQLFASGSVEKEIPQLLGLVKNDPVAKAGLRRSFIDNLLEDARKAGPNVNMEQPLSQAKFGQLLKKYDRTIGQLFTADERAVMQNVQRDLTRAEASNSVNRAMGSNTYQNLTVARILNVASNGLLDPAGINNQSVSKLVGLLYRAPEQRVQEILAEAMANPQLAKALIAKAGPASVDRAVKLLEQSLGQRVAGVAGEAGRAATAIGANLTAQEPTMLEQLPRR